jgi:hypothetical protein
MYFLRTLSFHDVVRALKRREPRLALRISHNLLQQRDQRSGLSSAHAIAHPQRREENAMTFPSGHRDPNGYAVAKRRK